MRLLLVVLVAGCFSPSVPSGGYLCSPADQACPSGQKCVCGLCVAHEDEAACGFTVDIGAGSLMTHEHEPFSVTIDATTRSGAASSHFGGTVDLSFRLPDGTVWGDVRPSSVQLSGGHAQLMVTVNRETIPPQEPALEARFADGRGRGAPITVLPQPLSRDSAPVAQAPFGWADVAVGFPSVTWDGAQFRMYFVGAGMRMQRGVGVATSKDGKSFVPNGVPLFPDAGFMPFVLSAFPYQMKDQTWRIASYADQMGGDLYIASSDDGMSAFKLLDPAPALSRTSCAYCDFTVWFPSVLVDGDQQLLFFGAQHCNQAMCKGPNDGVSMSIGRAHATDGVHFTPEPAPVLSGDMGGETYLAAPQVVKDGSIYKMWYAFTRDITFNDPCLANINVGYATSSDGFYWVRSPSNPVVSLDGTGWEGNTHAMLPGSVVPADGKDFESGVVLYYSPLQTVIFAPYCIPNGIGRAKTP